MKKIDCGSYNELLIGCGSRRNKTIHPTNRPNWENLYTLDINPNHKPDFIWDLTNLPLPFEDDSFDEIHAYEVLEHTGNQGDYRFFFAQFSDIWRILKPGGVLFGTTPHYTSSWAFGDPSHTRTIQKESFIFLDQAAYKGLVGVTPMSDFRHIYTADFSFGYCVEENGNFQFGLEAVKPSRIHGANTFPANTKDEHDEAATWCDAPS